MNQEKIRNSIIVILATFLTVGAIYFIQRRAVSPEQQQLRQQLQELQQEKENLADELKGLQDNDVSSSQETSSDSGSAGDSSMSSEKADLASCFAEHSITPPPATTTWPQQRNYVMGVQIFRPPGMQVIRQNSLESTGLEVFRLTSNAYEGGFMNIYDLRVRQYSTLNSSGEGLSFAPLTDSWYLGTSECNPVSSAITIGSWPIYALDLSSGTVVHKKYIIAHPTVEERPDRPPAVVEFEINQDTAELTVKEKEAFNEYLSQFEQATQSVRFFEVQN